jgi:hypothetical protein
MTILILRAQRRISVQQCLNVRVTANSNIQPQMGYCYDYAYRIVKDNVAILILKRFLLVFSLCTRIWQRRVFKHCPISDTISWSL